MKPHAYRPEIDGLRAVSVVSVLLFHAGLGCPGGYVGVDVFFVISGYLITRLILSDLAAGRFRLLDFWERRIRRLFPALAVLVWVTLGTGYLLLLPGDFEALAKSTMAHALLMANVYFWQHIDYFSGPAELKPLMHTWSLAVEEQFYLIFPFLLLACRKLDRWQLVKVLGPLFAASLLLSIWGSYANPSATFYLLPTRAWELLAGACLAVLPQATNSRRFGMELMSWLGLAGILAAVFLYDADTRFPGASALLPCLGACLVMYSNTAEVTQVGRMLSWKPAVLGGLISYSLYLWHWPLLAFLRYMFGERLSVELRCLAVIMSLLVAYLSWGFVESPFRLRTFASRRRVFSSACVSSLLVLGTTVGICAASGLPDRFSAIVLHLVNGNEIPKRFRGEGTLKLGVSNEDQLEPVFLLWGDSHAQAIGALIDRMAIEHGISGYIAMRNATTPILGTWRPNKGPAALAWNQSVIEFIKQKNIKHVILASRWAINIDGRPNGSTASLIVDANSPKSSPSASKEVFRRGLRRTIDELTAAGAQVWVMRQLPQQADDVPRLLARSALFHWDESPAGVSLAEYRQNQRNVDQIFAEMQSTTVRILDPAQYCFDQQGRSLITGAGRSYYIDDNHLSPFGAERLLRPLFEPVFSQIERDCHPGAGSIARATAVDVVK